MNPKIPNIYRDLTLVLGDLATIRAKHLALTSHYDMRMKALKAAADLYD